MTRFVQLDDEDTVVLSSSGGCRRKYCRVVLLTPPLLVAKGVGGILLDTVIQHYQSMFTKRKRSGLIGGLPKRRKRAWWVVGVTLMYNEHGLCPDPTFL